MARRTPPSTASWVFIADNLPYHVIAVPGSSSRCFTVGQSDEPVVEFVPGQVLVKLSDAERDASPWTVIRTPFMHWPMQMTSYTLSEPTPRPTQSSGGANVRGLFSCEIIIHGGKLLYYSAHLDTHHAICEVHGGGCPKKHSYATCKAFRSIVFCQYG